MKPWANIPSCFLTSLDNITMKHKSMWRDSTYLDLCNINFSKPELSYFKISHILLVQLRFKELTAVHYVDYFFLYCSFAGHDCEMNCAILWVNLSLQELFIFLNIESYIHFTWRKVFQLITNSRLTKHFSQSIWKKKLLLKSIIIDNETINILNKWR